LRSWGYNNFDVTDKPSHIGGIGVFIGVIKLILIFSEGGYDKL